MSGLAFRVGWSNILLWHPWQPNLKSYIFGDSHRHLKETCHARHYVRSARGFVQSHWVSAYLLFFSLQSVYLYVCLSPWTMSRASESLAQPSPQLRVDPTKRMSADSVDFVCRSLDPLYYTRAWRWWRRSDTCTVLRVQCIPFRGMYFGLVHCKWAKRGIPQNGMTLIPHPTFTLNDRS